MTPRFPLYDRLLLLLLIAAWLVACTPPNAPISGESHASVTADLKPSHASPTGEVVVFAAASLTDAFSHLGDAFTAQYPEAKVVFNFAGSQQLAQQLGQGAPADVFAAASARQMQIAVTAGRIDAGTRQTFARNRLVVIAPANNPDGIRTLQDLAAPNIKLVLAAEEVPVGAYTRTFLDKAVHAPELGESYAAAVLANVVSLETNVRAVLSKVNLGEADAGIVYASDVVTSVARAADPSPSNAASAPVNRVQRIEIPDAYNVIATYPIAPVVDARNPALAQRFVQFVLGEMGQAILAEHGFIPSVENGPTDAPTSLP